MTGLSSIARSFPQTFTVENTVMRGKRADVYVWGKEVKHVYEAHVFGPFVLAWSIMCDTAGKPVLDLSREGFASRLHFGIGRVVISDR